MADSLSRTLARFVDGLQFDNLPAEVPDKVKTSLLHSLIGTFLGAETAHGKASIELVKMEEARNDGATILVDGARATRCGAAFANSKLMHATNPVGFLPNASSSRSLRYSCGPGYGAT